MRLQAYGGLLCRRQNGPVRLRLFEDRLGHGAVKQLVSQQQTQENRPLAPRLGCEVERALPIDPIGDQPVQVAQPVQARPRMFGAVYTEIQQQAFRSQAGNLSATESGNPARSPQYAGVEPEWEVVGRDRPVQLDSWTVRPAEGNLAVALQQQLLGEPREMRGDS